MSHPDWFSAENVILDLQSGDKGAVLDELLDRMAETGSLPSHERAAIGAALKAREAQGSTGIGHGVAIPHVRTSLIDRVVTAVGIHREGIDFHAVDGGAVKIVLLIVRPEENHEEHLSFLRWISRLGRSADFRSFMRQAKSTSEVVALFEEMRNV